MSVIPEDFTEIDKLIGYKPAPKRAVLDVSEDEDYAIRTIIGEAKNQNDVGKRAVAGVIRNRANGAGQSYKDIVLAKSQFEPWSHTKTRNYITGIGKDSPLYQQIAQTVLPVLRGEAPDPTNGATHFYAPKAQKALGRPTPDFDNGKGIDIGDHRFFHLGYSGNGRHGTKAASVSVPKPSVNFDDIDELIGYGKFAKTPTPVDDFTEIDALIGYQPQTAPEDTGTIYGQPANAYNDPPPPALETDDTILAQLKVAIDPKKPRKGVFFPENDTERALQIAQSLDQKEWGLFPDKQNKGYQLVHLPSAKKLKLRSATDIQRYIDKNPNALVTLTSKAYNAGQNTGDNQHTVATIDPQTGTELTASVVTPETRDAQVALDKANHPEGVSVDTTTNAVVAKRLSETGEELLDPNVIANAQPMANQAARQPLEDMSQLGMRGNVSKPITKPLAKPTYQADDGVISDVPETQERPMETLTKENQSNALVETIDVPVGKKVSAREVLNKIAPKYNLNVDEILKNNPNLEITNNNGKVDITFGDLNRFMGGDDNNLVPSVQGMIDDYKAKQRVELNRDVIPAEISKPSPTEEIDAEKLVREQAQKNGGEEWSILNPDDISLGIKKILENPSALWTGQAPTVTPEERRQAIDDGVSELIRNAGSASKMLALTKEYEAMSGAEKTVRHVGDFATTILRSPATFARTAAWAEDAIEYLHEKGIPVPTLTPTEVLNAVGWTFGKVAGKDIVPLKAGQLPKLYADIVDKLYPDDPVTRATTAGKLSRAAGSAVPFLIGATLSGGSMSAVALLGIGQSVGDMYKQAADAGLSREKQILSGLAGIPLGASEVLGLKWAKLGELIEKRSKGVFLKGLMGWLAETGKEATEETIQEYFQSVGGKLVIEGLKKNGLTKADVAKALGSSVDDAMTGGIIGALFGGGVPVAAKAANVLESPVTKADTNALLKAEGVKTPVAEPKAVEPVPETSPDAEAEPDSTPAKPKDEKPKPKKVTLEPVEDKSDKVDIPVKEYPLADPPEYTHSNYKDQGGSIITSTPEEFLSLARDLKMDDEVRDNVRDNVDDLKKTMESGRRVDPAIIYLKDGKITGHDGRHRALAAQELGIKDFPILVLDESHKPVTAKSLQELGLSKQTAKPQSTPAPSPIRERAKREAAGLVGDDVVEAKGADVTFKETPSTTAIGEPSLADLGLANKPWREIVDSPQLADNLMRRHAILREMAKGTDQERSDVLDRIEGEKYGNASNIAWDIATNPKASDAVRERAQKMYDAIYPPVTPEQRLKSDRGRWQRNLKETQQENEQLQGQTGKGVKQQILNNERYIAELQKKLADSKPQSPSPAKVGEQGGKAVVEGEAAKSDATRDFVLPNAKVTRPLADKGLTSYRYRTDSGGHVAIGAKDNTDALNEAGRSITGKPDVAKLDVWNGTEYVPVSERTPTTDTLKALRKLGYSLPFAKSLTDAERQRILDEGIEKKDYGKDVTENRFGNNTQPVESKGQVHTSIEDAPDYGVYAKRFPDGTTWYGFKKPDGNPDGAGNRLVATAEDAQREADRYKKEVEYRKETAERQEAKRIADEQEKESRKPIADFDAGLSPMQRGKIQKSLNKLWNIDGKHQTTKQYVEDAVKSGTLELDSYDENRIKDMTRQQFNRATNEQQQRHEQRIKDGGKVTKYLVNGLELGKTAYDYAAHLQNKSESLQNKSQIKSEPLRSVSDDDYISGHKKERSRLMRIRQQANADFVKNPTPEVYKQVEIADKALTDFEDETKRRAKDAPALWWKESEPLRSVPDIIDSKGKTSSVEKGEALRSTPAESSPFYSRVESVIADKMPNKATPEQVTALLLKNGTKELDPEFTALKLWLDNQGGSVTKADVAEFVAANKVDVQEVVKEDKASEVTEDEVAAWWNDEGGANEEVDFYDLSPTEQEKARERYLTESFDWSEDNIDHGVKFAQWQLPGESENYREEFLTAPRANGKTDIDVKQIEEAIQEDGSFDLSNGQTISSDSSRGGFSIRDKDGNTIGHGFSVEEALKESSPATDWKDGHSDYDDIVNPIARIRYNDRVTTDGDKMLFAEEFQQPSKDNIAKMPKVYQKYGEQMAIRKMLYRAVEGGYDYFGFTTGQQQADRYSLAKQVESINVEVPTETDGEVRFVTITPKSGDKIYLETENGKVRESEEAPAEMIGKPLEDVVGKPMAEKILEVPIEDGWAEFSGEDLKVGGIGLAQRYDRKHVDYINKLMKPYGVSVEAKDISTLDPEAGFDDGSEKETIHAVRISPEFRKAVEASMRDNGGAFPLFKVRTTEDSAELTQLAKSKNFSTDIVPHLKVSIDKGQFGKSILSLDNNQTVEFARTLLAITSDVARDEMTAIDGLFLDPQQVANIKDAALGVQDAFADKGKDTKPIEAFVKALDKAASVNGTVQLEAFENARKHEMGHAASYLGAGEKALVKRRSGLKELADTDPKFAGAFNKWAKIEGRNWTAENATPSQLAHGAEEVATYIADGQHSRLGLTYAQGIKLGVELQLRYAQARIDEGAANVAEALAIFDGTIFEQYKEAINEREQSNKSDKGNVESKGAGQDNEYQGRDPGTEESDGDGVSSVSASEQKAKGLDDRRPGKSGLPFDEQEAREADAKGRKVAAISRIIGVEIYYDPQSNTETAVKAEQLTGRVGVQKAIADALTGKPSAEGMKVVYNEFSRLNALYDHFNEQGNEAEAIAIATELADLANAIQERQLATGQEAQIARTFDILSPDIALLMAQRRIINKRGEGAKLTPEETAATIDAAKQLQKIEAQLEETRRKLRNSEAARRRLESDKEPRKRAATSQEKLLKEYQEQKTDLFAQLEKLFPDSPLFNGKEAALRMVADPTDIEKGWKKWRRSNITYRGVAEENATENGRGAMLGAGLYTAPSSNRSMTREYGKMKLVANARPKNPKVFDSLNRWEIWAQGNLFNKFSKNEFPDVRSFNANTTIEKEMLKMGYDGIEIKGREIVNFAPPDNVVYFDNERQARQYYDAVVFEDNSNEALRSTPTEPLDPLKQEVLTKWATGQILEGLPYEALIKTLGQFGISQVEAQQIHSDAVDIIKPAREPRTAEAKDKVKIRNEHYREAKKFASDGKPALSGIAQDAKEDAKYKDDPKLIEVIDYLTNVNTAKAGRSLNQLINGIRESNPEMSISQAEALAGHAQQAVNDLRIKRKRAADKAKNISEEARQEINRLTVQKRNASRRMSDHLKQLGKGTEWAMHRFNNLMRAAFVNNWVTQIFNAVQSTAVATPTQMALDGITQLMLRGGLNIGENTEINLKDILLPEAYIFANNKQLAEQALAHFPEEYFRIHAGILGDIEIDKVAQADTAPKATKWLHTLLDYGDKGTDFLSKLSISKVQEMYFRNAIIASRFDQLIQAKSKGTETLESALKNGQFAKLVTEKDATKIADDALEVTFASEINDPIGKKLKSAYDVLDNFVPIFLNPVTYARFTYTTTKVMVANPLLFGAMDAKAAGGRGYNTKSVAKGVLAWSGVAVAYALTSALGGDDDRWDTLYVNGTDNPPLSIKRFFPLSAYFYVAHLIRQYKEGGTPPTYEDLLEGFMSLETEYYTYGPGMELGGSVINYGRGTGSGDEVGRAGARMMGNFFGGLLSVLKPAKLALSAIDDEEATLRDDSDTAKEKFISEISRSVPGAIRLSDAPKKIDPVTDKPILQPWILGRAVGLNFVHPSFLANKDSAATQWANRVFSYEGGSSKMSAEDRNAYFIRKRLKEAVRRGEIDLTTANEKAQQYLAKILTPESLKRLQGELKLSELQSKIKAGFSQPDDPKKAAKELRDLRVVWEKATDQEKEDIRKILSTKRNLSPEFIEEFGVTTTKQAKMNKLPDNLESAFDKLGIKPPGVGDTLTPTKGGEKVKLTPEQQAKYEAEVIERIDKKVESLQTSTAYKNADDALRKKMVEGIIRKQKAEEMNETKGEMRKLADLVYGKQGITSDWQINEPDLDAPGDYKVDTIKRPTKPDPRSEPILEAYKKVMWKANYDSTDANNQMADRAGQLLLRRIKNIPLTTAQIEAMEQVNPQMAAALKWKEQRQSQNVIDMRER